MMYIYICYVISIGIMYYICYSFIFLITMAAETLVQASCSPRISGSFLH